MFSSRVRLAAGSEIAALVAVDGPAGLAAVGRVLLRSLAGRATFRPPLMTSTSASVSVPRRGSSIRTKRPDTTCGTAVGREPRRQSVDQRLDPRGTVRPASRHRPPAASRPRSRPAAAVERFASCQACSVPWSTFTSDAKPICRKIGCRAPVARFSNSARAPANSSALRPVSCRTRSNTTLVSAFSCWESIERIASMTTASGGFCSLSASRRTASAPHVVEQAGPREQLAGKRRRVRVDLQQLPRWRCDRSR